jgi:hypothetical protein
MLTAGSAYGSLRLLIPIFVSFGFAVDIAGGIRERFDLGRRPPHKAALAIRVALLPACPVELEPSRWWWKFH